MSPFLSILFPVIASTYVNIVGTSTVNLVENSLLYERISSAPLDTLPRFRGAISENAVYVASKRYVYRIVRTGGAVGDPLLAREGRKVAAATPCSSA